MKPRPYSIGDKVIRDMRHRLDFILSDCLRYFKRHDPSRWAAECSKCTRRQTEPANHEPCGMAFAEEQRILSMLRGIGLSDRYTPKKSGVRVLHNRFGRIKILRGKEDER